MKYYYTDPLAAAWMAKHFGMAFDIFAQPSGVRVEKEKSTAKYIAMLGDAYRCYIHPDSLHLLEPKAGDIVFYDNLFGGEAWDELKCMVTPDDDRYPYVGTGEPLMLMDSGEHPYRKELRRIIQRSGIAFMWPEVEA